MKRRFRPSLDRMEGRELLSVSAILALRHRAVPAATAVPPPVVNPSGLVNGANGTTLTQGAPNEYQYLTPTGTPTAREARRQPFVFTFSGAFRQGPPQYNDESSLIHIEGVGRSTFFLHGDVQIGAVVPTDLTRPTSGVATSFDRNINTSSVFGFDLDGSTADLDAAGRPTRFTALTDVNLSSGLFAESQSVATVTIKYIPDGKPHARGTSAGKALVVIKGYAYTLGTGNVLGGPISRTGTNPSRIRV